MEKDKYDKLIIRCPSLGGEVPFVYCRSMNNRGPCSRLPMCWRESFDVLGFIRKFYSPSEIDIFFAQSGPNRLTQIFKNLERVKKMKEEKNKRDELIEAIRKASPDGKMTCAMAWQLADQFDCPRREMGTLLNELKVKLIQCQLGCF